MITSSPVNIEESPPQEYHAIRGPHYTSVIQKRIPYVDVISKRTKDELVAYLMDLQDAIKTDQHQFGLLTTDSKKEFDILLVDVHNAVVGQLNRINDANRKRKYINAYIRKIRHESFMARGNKSNKKKSNKKSNKNKKNMRTRAFKR